MPLVCSVCTNDLHARPARAKERLETSLNIQPPFHWHQHRLTGRSVFVADRRRLQGTNLPSCATPNGQAAFLFILTSTVAPLVQLSYFRMIKMTAPYTITLSIAGLVGILTMNMHE